MPTVFVGLNYQRTAAGAVSSPTGCDSGCAGGSTCWKSVLVWKNVGEIQ